MKNKKRKRKRNYQEVFEQILNWSLNFFSTAYCSDPSNNFFKIVLFVIWPLLAVIFLIIKMNHYHKKHKKVKRHYQNHHLK
ncbi:hypothetical protein [Lactobacillus sp. ESL0681]|uniref:hypothetical protein n=1 Tax=Lactobacillus sp. ESL0681 TaxID=2983211 RepID=UPI0023F72DE9|nr:hypothetical protein [Lactobacillus sp. ESL0681]WEV41299.1 hypothetical protein OZX59_09535 [Lactobacillus sp. ESL0681]